MRAEMRLYSLIFTHLGCPLSAVALSIRAASDEEAIQRAAMLLRRRFGWHWQASVWCDGRCVARQMRAERYHGRAA